MRKILWCALWMNIFVSLAFADGKGYWFGDLPPGIPSQRALICHDGEQQTLIVQTSFQTEEALTTSATLGWVVPSPAMPEVDSFSSEAGWSIFWFLSKATAPKQIYPAEVFLVLLFCAVAISGAVTILSILYPRSAAKRYKPVCLRIFAYGGIILVLSVIAVPNFLSAGDHIRMLEEKDIGNYNARIIEADTSAALIEWLNQNGFVFGKEDEKVFDNYIARGWCFVVAKIRPDAEEHFRQSMMDPLVLRFSAEKPVYPLALTSTVGSSTEVLIYTLSRQKLSCGERMQLKFARAYENGFWKSHNGILDRDDDDWTDPFKEWEKELPWICKFKAVLSPSEMESDLVFEYAGDDKDYREIIYAR